MAIAFILKGYPRLSETFIAQEIHALEKRGMDIRIVSLRHPTDRQRHPITREIKAPVRYLPEYLHHEPARVWRGYSKAKTMPGFAAARRTWLADLRREPTQNRIRRFGQACVLAAELPGDVDRLHAHFLHTPASVARYAAIIRGMPWSVSAHAKDIWTTPHWEIREKLADASWLVTCTQTGAEFLKSLAPDPGKVTLAYHGLDLNRFPAPKASGREKRAHLVIVSVGRAVPKKGYEDCLMALAALPKDIPWRFRHIGGGPLLSQLEDGARALGVDDRVTWRGPQPQETVLEELRQADVFVLASRVTADGDRDGLPNVLMEAQSQRLPVIATDVSGIPELILNGETGLLVPPGDVVGLADALATVLLNPSLRRRLGQAGYVRLKNEFTLDKGIDILAKRFDLPSTSVAA